MLRFYTYEGIVKAFWQSLNGSEDLVELVYSKPVVILNRYEFLYNLRQKIFNKHDQILTI